MLKGFSLGAAPGAERRGVPIKTGGMGCKVAFARPHLMEMTGYEFGEAHEGVGRERRWVRVAWGWRSERAPLQEEDRPGFFSEGGVQVRGSFHRGDGQGRDQLAVVGRKEKPVLKQGKRPVGDLIDGEVLADRHLGCFPHNGAVGGVQLDQQGAMTEWGAVSRPVWDRPVEPGRRRIDFGRGADHPQGRHALSVFHKEDKRG